MNKKLCDMPLDELLAAHTRGYQAVDINEEIAYRVRVAAKFDRAHAMMAQFLRPVTGYLATVIEVTR